MVGLDLKGGDGSSSIATGPVVEVGSPEDIKQRFLNFSRAVTFLVDPPRNSKVLVDTVIKPAMESRYGESVVGGGRRLTINFTGDELTLFKTGVVTFIDMARKSDRMVAINCDVPPDGKIYENIHSKTDSLYIEGSDPRMKNSISIDLRWLGKGPINSPKRGPGNKLGSWLNNLKTRLKGETELGGATISFRSIDAR